MRYFFIVLFLMFSCSFNVPVVEARRGDRCDYPGIPTKYDSLIKSAVKKYQVEPLRSNWCIVKAVLWIESRIDSNAESPVGAVGAGQIMPITEKTFRNRVKFEDRPTKSHDLRNIRYNLAISTLTQNRYWLLWIARRTSYCRLGNMVVTYNSGPGPQLKAQDLSGGKSCFPQWREFLVQVTGKHAKENIDYYTRFFETLNKLKYGDVL